MNQSCNGGVIGLFMVAALAACSAPQVASSRDDSAPSERESGGDDESPGDLGGGSKTPPSSTSDCSDASKLVYVVSEDHDLYSFAPDKLAFAKIGKLSCEPAGRPNSMSVGRDGTAWINYDSGAIYKVSTKDASCTKSTFVPNGFVVYGMGFSTKSAGSADETLFVVGAVNGVNDDDHWSVSTIDTTSLKLSPLGDFTGALRGRGAELTGTGDGHLFGFVTTRPSATLAEIDPKTGATSKETTLPGVNANDQTEFAFSFWGGDFWFYSATGDNASSVTRLDKATNEVSVVKADVGGFRIVGAGVSTCAPTTMPR